MKIKAILFDMDGVLIDSSKHHIACWKKAFEDEGIYLPEETFALNEGRSSRDTQMSLSNQKIQNFNPELLSKISDRKNKYMPDILEIGAFEGVFEFIQKLKNMDIKTVVVTGSSKEFASKMINKNYKDLFDAFVTSDDVQRCKPHPDPYLKAVEVLGVNKEDCVIIENAPLGIESGKSAGIKVYALETTLDKSHLSQADMIFENHKLLIEHFLKHELADEET